MDLKFVQKKADGNQRDHLSHSLSLYLSLSLSLSLSLALKML